jgi:hypothetical protein
MKEQAKRRNRYMRLNHQARWLLRSVVPPWFIGIALIQGLCASVQAQNATTARTASASATIKCIGIQWPITGDANHNATCQTEYRKQGAGTWEKALPLLRCDNSDHNGLYGSIFCLDPRTDYEIRLTLSDPDGGGTSTTISAKTRSVPQQPTSGRTYHVVPGSGGGDGSAGNPFKGIAAAETVAQPGDTFRLHAGNYGIATFTKGGSSDNHIVWKAAGDGDAVLGGIYLNASGVWLHSLHITLGRDYIKDKNGRSTGLTTQRKSAGNICITFCTFRGFRNTMDVRGNGWYITDNDISGDGGSGLSGEGIELNKSSGHIVAHNRITHCADAISYPSSNVDIYRNDIHDVSDDAVETDMGRVNVRVWQNRITNPSNSAFSFQPMGSGPWYFIQNQVLMTNNRPWKFVKEVDDRFVVAHNTFVFPGRASEYAQCWLNSVNRNNLIISYGNRGAVLFGGWHPRKPGTPGLNTTPFWMTDWDYNGYDWDGKSTPFSWFGTGYPDLPSFASGVGVDKNSVQVDRAKIFENWSTPSKVVGQAPVDYTLAPGSNAAVDAGVIMYNINDNYLGNGPDLGALERGKPVPHYGPRYGGHSRKRPH